VNLVFSKLKLIVALIFIGAIVFFVSGYRMSDDRYFGDLIQEHKIKTPEDAFAFVNQNTVFVTGEPTLELYTTPRYMLRKGVLWCDESAMVLATIADKLGSKTRLVDVIKENDIAGHTYLQIYENGEWINYDTVLKKNNLTHEEILQGFNNSKLKGSPRPRPYPRLYNRIIQNNFYLKHLALWLRNAPG
jgi:hypothetical protein